MAELKIYTRKGDDGMTGLWYGGRIAKSDPRTQAYGTIDEACSALGVSRSICQDAALAKNILRVQNELFMAGAQLATAPEAQHRLEAGSSKLDASMVAQLEADIDHYMSKVDLPPKFVIPGGTELSATLDLARTIVRRGERTVVDLQLADELPDGLVLEYLNRLSDLLFAMARYSDVPKPELFEGRG